MHATRAASAAGRLSRAILLGLCASAAGGASLAADEEIPRYPTDLRGRTGEAGYRILSLDPALGFRRFRSLTYILDPALRDAESSAYRPAAGESGASGFDADPGLRALLLPGKGGTIRAALLVEEVLGDFFRLAAERAVPRANLMEVLRENGARASEIERHVLAVSARFRVLPAREKNGRMLECRLEMRLFKLRLSPIPAGDPIERRLANLSYCELVYRDTAPGRVPIDEFAGRPEDAVRAAVIDALRGRLAVTFALNPRINHLEPEKPLASDICGFSLAEFKSRGK